jgi:hypothetical protein
MNGHEKRASPTLPSPIDVFIANVSRAFRIVGILGDSFKWFDIETEKTKDWLASNPTLDLVAWQIFMTRAEQRNVEVLDRWPLAIEWLCVLFVTFTETYLFDALAAAAGHNRNLLPRGFSHKFSYDYIRDHASTENLDLTMREIWARGFVSQGGPKEWTKRLSDMGARISVEYLDPLDELWGVRNTLVHRAGLADRDFRRLHGGVPLSPEGRVIVSKERLGIYMQSAVKFVIAINGFFEAARPQQQPPSTET